MVSVVISYRVDTHGRFNTESTMAQRQNVDSTLIRCYAHDEKDHKIHVVKKVSNYLLKSIPSLPLSSCHPYRNEMQE